MLPIEYSTSMLIGTTTRGITSPVFWDPHTPIFNNKPPVCLITGAPGSGKTFLALTLTTISAITGKTTVVLDPKGDFLSLMNLDDQIGDFNLWDLSNSRRKGILDPFYMAKDPGEKLSLVISVIDLFVGGLSGSQLTALSPIIKDVIDSPNPSLTLVMNELRSSRNAEARDLGTKLDIISRMPFAKLCFAPSNRANQNVEINKGLTVITLLGLELPADAEAAKSDNKGRLASGVLFLLTDFIRRIMMNDNSVNPKTIVIDEAWAVLASKVGVDTIKSLSLLGRSKQLALILITQTPSHLDGIDIDNTITTRFAFRSTRQDAGNTVKAMDLPKDEGFEETITSLEGGECLMQDFLENFSTVKITSWREDWAIAFNSNPLHKIRQQKSEGEKAQAR